MNGEFSPARSTDPDPIAGLHGTVLASRPGADLDLIRRAYDVAARCHQGQLRKSGDPYISHPVMVATIMAGLGADDQTLCAAILHDTVDDTPFTLTALRREFGAGVAALVAEHTRLDHLRTRYGFRAAETLAAIGSADGRVATLKMADRLHNMRTVEFLPPPKQLLKAREVLDVFASAAEQLSLPAIGTETADAGLRHADPEPAWAAAVAPGDHRPRHRAVDQPSRSGQGPTQNPAL